MKLSIVSPVFNGAAHLAKHLESIEGQKFSDFEHILVDNMSTDGTEEMIRAYVKRAKHPVRYIRESDRGVYEAMNKGIRYASGEWIHILNADNAYRSTDILSEIFIKKLEEYDWLACGGFLEKINTSPIYMKPEYDSELDDYRFPHQGNFIRKNFYRNHGVYSEYFRIVSDSIFIVQNIRKAKLLLLDIPAVTIRAGGLSGTASARNTLECVILILVYHRYPLVMRLRMAIRTLWHYILRFIK